MSGKGYERYDKIREIRGLTDYQVSKLSNIRGGTAPISNWKNSEYVPKDDKMRSIADVLGVSVDYLRGDAKTTLCPVCGYCVDLLNDFDREHHEEVHKKCLKIKEIYPFFTGYTESEQKRDKSIAIINSCKNDIQKQLEEYENYLQSSFSLEIIRNGYDITNLKYDDFCKEEVSLLHSDSNITEELIDEIIKKYGIDKRYMASTEHLLIRASKNPRLIRLLSCAEKLSPETLDMLIVQAEALYNSSRG